MITLNICFYSHIQNFNSTIFIAIVTLPKLLKLPKYRRVHCPPFGFFIIKYKLHNHVKPRIEPRSPAADRDSLIMMNLVKFHFVCLKKNFERKLC